MWACWATMRRDGGCATCSSRRGWTCPGCAWTPGWAPIAACCWSTRRPAGGRSCASRGLRPADLTLDDADRAYIQATRVLHLDGQFLPAAVQAARWAKEAGVKVCFDGNHPRPGLEELLPLVDWLVVAEAFPTGLYRQAGAGGCCPVAAGAGAGGRGRDAGGAGLPGVDGGQYSGRYRPARCRWWTRPGRAMRFTVGSSTPCCRAGRCAGGGVCQCGGSAQLPDAGWTARAAGAGGGG